MRLVRCPATAVRIVKSCGGISEYDRSEQPNTIASVGTRPCVIKLELCSTRQDLFKRNGGLETGY